MGVLVCLKKFMGYAVPHVIILCMLFGYLSLGAAIFYFLEGGQSELMTYQADIDKLKNMCREASPSSQPGAGNTTGSTPAVYRLTVPPLDIDTPAPGVVVTTAAAESGNIDGFLDELIRLRRPDWTPGRVQTAGTGRGWTFASSMLFCMTTITTIGYGDMVPVTAGGKVFCVVYSVFGIPLALLYMGGVGSFLARLILMLCRILHLGRPIRKAMCPCGSSSQRNSPDVEVEMPEEDLPPADGEEPPAKALPSKPGAGNSNNHASIVTSQHGVDASTAREEDIEAPVVLVVAILVGYMCFGAFVMSQIEMWTFGDALYFTFITLTTIGFGDYVPMKLYKEDAFFACIVYTMIGLAVMSMCVTLLQAKVRRFGSKCMTCIGL